MRRSLLPWALLVLSLPIPLTPAAAQPAFAGQPFPLTNTRYGAAHASGTTRLATNGRDFFLFWPGIHNVRMTKVVAGERRAGRPVLPSRGPAIDAIWTGQHFLVAAGDFTTISGQLVTADGDRIGAPFPLADASSAPRLASSRTTMVLLYSVNQQRGGLSAATIGSNGAIGARRVLLPEGVPGGPAVRGFEIASNGAGFAVVVSRTDGDQLLTLDGSGELRTLTMLTASAGDSRIASDGRGYLVATAVNDRTVIRRVDANSTVSAPVTLSEPGIPASVVWNGSAYAVAVVDGDETHIVYLDATGVNTTAMEPVALNSGGGSPQLAAIGERLMAAWGHSNRAFVADIPLASSAGREALFGASEQTLLATVAGNESTLFVWRELIEHEGSLHAGVRMRDGTWNEQLLAGADITSVVAASNGHDFVVMLTGAGSLGPTYRIQSNGQSMSGPPTLTRPGFDVESMIWDGERYVLVGGNHVLVAAMSEDLVVSPPVTIRQSSSGYDHRRIAWNGREYFAIWHDGTKTIGTRIGRDLRRLGSDVLFGTDGTLYGSRIVADGLDFVVIRETPDALRVARVAGGMIASCSPIADSANAEEFEAAAVTGGVVVAWQNGETHVHHAVALRQGSGALVARHELLKSESSPFVAALPGAKAIVATAAPIDPAPHHGASRVSASVLDFVPLAPLTTAPQVSIRLQGTRLRIEWTALPQPVTGYRVEYRIGDGNWNEIERSPDPASRSATFLPPRQNTTYSFRVRAMSDAGMGPYSTPVSAYLGKRRSVR